MEYEQCNISNKKQKLLKAGNLWKLSYGSGRVEV